jgi:general secretion pathway protein E/type IV pilus assembly protein PilB
MNWEVLITSQSVSLGLNVMLLGAWMAGAVLSSRFSGLSESKRPWANLLSLAAGPVGWAMHLTPRLGSLFRRESSNNDDQVKLGRVAHDILAQALTEGASDIHIEAQESGYVVRTDPKGSGREMLIFGLARSDARIEV